MGLCIHKMIFFSIFVRWNKYINPKAKPLPQDHQQPWADYWELVLNWELSANTVFFGRCSLPLQENRRCRYSFKRSFGLGASKEMLLATPREAERLWQPSRSKIRAIKEPLLFCHQNRQCGSFAHVICSHVTWGGTGAACNIHGICP